MLKEDLHSHRNALIYLYGLQKFARDRVIFLFQKDSVFQDFKFPNELENGLEISMV